MFGWLRRLLGPTISVTGGEAHFPGVSEVGELNMHGGTVQMGGGQEVGKARPGRSIPPGLLRVRYENGDMITHSPNFEVRGPTLHVSVHDRSVFLAKNWRGVILTDTLTPNDIPEAIRLLERAREELERG